MRIGIDASRAFVKDPTGTERYSYEVITRLLKLPEAKRHTWILYCRGFEDRGWRLDLEGGKFDVLTDQKFKKSKTQNLTSNIQIQNIRLKYLWTQVGLAARTWVDNLDVLWIPAHTLPVFRKPGIRTVVTIHGIEYEWLPAYENRLQRWYLPLSTQYAVRSCEKIIAVSEFTKKQLVERLGASADKIEVVYEGVSRNAQRSMLNAQSILDKYNLQKKKYILFVGTVQPRKNLQRLIEAFANLKSQISNLKLVIAGKLGWGYNEVVTLARKHGVIITGYINEAERYILLQNALVYVQPSISEGFGLPVLEAFSAGVPVVTSKGGALMEVVGGAGLLFDPLDVADICHKLSLVIDSHKLRRELIDKGRKRVREFGWDKTTRETYRILTKNSKAERQN